MTIHDLERAAIEHHQRGGRWNDFWAMHGDEIRAAVGCWDRSGFRRLYQKLLALCVSGNQDGQRAVGDDEPWLADEARAEPKAADVGTAARLQPEAIGR